MAPLLLALTGALGMNQALGEHWPEFRGPEGEGRSVQTDLPVEWDSERNVAWKKTLDGQGWSSPIVDQERIYLTTAVAIDVPNAPRSLRTLCLDASTGDLIWDKEIVQVEPRSIHEKNSYASPTPITDGRFVYVHFGPHGTAALDMNGEVVWRNTTIRYDTPHGGGGSPILSGDLLIFTCDGIEDPFVVALDKNNGKERWRTYRPQMEPQRFSFATPLEIEHEGRRQIVCPGSSFVCAYAPESGEELWHVGFSTRWSVIPRPVYAAGLVFATTGYEGPASLLAIRPDGSGDVTDTHVAWKSEKSIPHTPSALIVDDNLFFVSDNGVASCLDVRTGAAHWRQRLGGNYSASLFYANGRIYCQSEEGECVVFSASTTFEELARNDLKERSLASFAAADGALFVRTATQLYRIEDRP